jgi:hypothetical protein
MNRALQYARSRLAFCASAVLVGALGLPSVAAAQDSVFPMGVACKDFDLGLSIRGGNQVYREFLDRNGNVVRKLSAGRGNVQTFTNMATGEELTLKTSGSVEHTTYNPDGTRTVTATGHNLVIFFPTDVPAGPATTLYIGKLVYLADAQETFVKLSTSGQQVDICAALSM